jgi:acyl carrier protein
MLDSGKVSLFDSPSVFKRAENGEESELKAVLRQMFSDALGLPTDEITDNGHFMNDLGGSSLDYFSLVSAINERFSVTLDYEGDGFTYTLNDFEKKVKELIK